MRFARPARFRVLIALCACAASAPLRAEDPPAPAFADVSVHDPAIVRDGSIFWIFGSHMASASTGDLMAWSQYSISADAPNPLARNNAPRTEFAQCLAYAQATTFWAPDVIRLGDGRYYYYYCACQGSMPLSALGLARADAIHGPYTDAGLLLKSMGASPTVSPYDATRMPNVVDPAVFFDQQGGLWMLYGSYSGGLFILRLDATADSPTLGQPLPGQGYGTKILGGNHAPIEGGYVIYSPESEYYYLFTSFGGLAANGGYNMRVFRSRAPDGPYVDAAGNNMATTAIPNNLWPTIAPYGVKIMGNCQFQTVAGEPGTARPGYVSPGHNSAYYDPTTDKYFLVFHTRFVGQGEFHQVRVHQMFLNADGWFAVAPHRYAGETIAPTDAGRIIGTYKWINHGKDMTIAVKSSTTITLAADGTVGGSATGTWELTGGYDATLVLDGVTYRGVFVRQWDESRSRWVLAFSAVDGANGASIWGSKVAIDTAPAFVVQPAGRTCAPGESVTLTALASGDPAPAYQWLRDGVPVELATGGTLAIKATPSAAGVYTVVATNAAGSATSADAAIAVTMPPMISAHPASLTQPSGTTAGFSVTASGTGPLAYQWIKNGGEMPGETTATLTLATIGTADAGDYTVRVSDSIGSITSRLARLVVASPSASRIANASVRSTAGIGGNPLIVGFVVDGGTKDILVRGVGPTLGNVFGVPGTMDDPRLDMHRRVNDVDQIVASNDDWADEGRGPAMAALFASLGAYPLESNASKDAALVAGVSGPRTVHVSGAGAVASGVVLVECYDAVATTHPRLVNVSARNFAGVAEQTLIAGFVIDGNQPRRVLIRGVGPTLADYGVSGELADPRLEVHTTIDKQDRIIAANDDWYSEPGVSEASAVTGAFALREDSLDAAVVLVLPAGVYTAHVSGVGGTTGEALVEVYELP